MVYQPRVVQMFRIVTDLEKRFSCPGAALKYYSGQPVFPKIPRHRLLFEDGVTPRICVAPTVEDCITAIGVEKFSYSSCFWGTAPMRDFETCEVFPIIIQKFGNNEAYYKPSYREVPDVAWTNEMWIREPATPIDTKLVWLDGGSIFANYSEDSEGNEGPIICMDVQFHLDPPPWGLHPWLKNTADIPI